MNMRAKTTPLSLLEEALPPTWPSGSPWASFPAFCFYYGNLQAHPKRNLTVCPRALIIFNTLQHLPDFTVSSQLGFSVCLFFQQGLTV